MLAHILMLHDIGQVEFALHSAARYEAESCGVLEGLHAKVLEVLAARKTNSTPGATHEL